MSALRQRHLANEHAKLAIYNNVKAQFQAELDALKKTNQDHHVTNGRLRNEIEERKRAIKPLQAEIDRLNQVNQSLISKIEQLWSFADDLKQTAKG